MACHGALLFLEMIFSAAYKKRTTARLGENSKKRIMNCQGASL